MSEKIGKFFVGVLRNNTTISTAVSGRIYPVGRPMDAEEADEVPYIVVMPQGVKPNETEDGEYSDNCPVNMTVCATTYEDLVSLTVEVRNAIKTAAWSSSSLPFEVVQITYSSSAPQIDPQKPCYFQELHWDVETI